MSKWREWYARFEDFFAGSLLVSGLGILFVGVIMRYLLKSPISWTFEIAGYFVVWGTLIGTAVALREGHHIQVDILYDRMPPFVKRIFNIFSNLLGIVFCFLFAFYGIKILNLYIMLDQRSMDSGIKLWIVYLALPTTGIMLGIRFLTNLIENVKGEVK